MQLWGYSAIAIGTIVVFQLVACRASISLSLVQKAVLRIVWRSMKEKGKKKRQKQRVKVRAWMMSLRALAWEDEEIRGNAKAADVENVAATVAPNSHLVITGELLFCVH